jgi:hypothetical protein
MEKSVMSEALFSAAAFVHAEASGLIIAIHSCVAGASASNATIGHERSHLARSRSMLNFRKGALTRPLHG